MQVAQFLQWVAASLHPKARARYKGLKAQYAQGAPKKSGRKILFHCASLGEYDQIKPLISRVRELNDSIQIVVSFFSSSGFEAVKHDKSIDAYYYLPLDTKRSVQRFVDFISPDEVVLVKYEIYYNLITCLAEKEIPIYLVSAIFFPEQIYFKSYGGIMRRALRKLDGIFVQDEYAQKQLRKINIDSVLVGDTRADRVLERKKQNKQDVPYLLKWKGDDKLLILGSIWPEDWRVFENQISHILREYKLLIAPHEMHQDFIDQMMQNIGLNVQKWSSINKEIGVETQAVILDKIGVLAASYQYGDVAFVGGGFKQGLHNIFEPAVYGLPVIFGPMLKAHPEAFGLIDKKAGFVVKNEQELLAILNSMENEETRLVAGQAASEYIEQAAGATSAIFAHLKENWK